jgi:hypothetical protein
LDLENKMDQESFDNFVKLKLESFKKDSIKWRKEVEKRR